MTSRVPATPVVLIVINGQGVRVNGVLVLHGPDVDLRQVGIRAAAERVATVHDRPVRAVLTDESVRLRLVIHPDGAVSDVEVDPTFEPAPPPEPPAGRGTREPVAPRATPAFPPPFVLPPAGGPSGGATTGPATEPHSAPVPAVGPSAPVRRLGADTGRGPVGRAARHRGSRWRRPALVAAGVVLLAGVGAWAVTRDGGSSPVVPAAGPSPTPTGSPVPQSPPTTPGPAPVAPLHGVQVDVTGPRPRTLRVEVSLPLPTTTSVALVPALHLRVASPDGRALTRVLRLSPDSTPAVAISSRGGAAAARDRQPRLQAELLLRGLDAGRYRWQLRGPGLSPITGRVRVIPVPVVTTEPSAPTTPVEPTYPTTPGTPSAPSSPASPQPHTPAHPQAPHSPSVPPGPVDPHA